MGNYIARTSTVPKIVFLLMLFVGVIQLYLSHVFHGNDRIIEKFGLYYPAIEEHEYWRFFIGPFFHSSIEHWIVNAAMLTITSFLLSTLPINKSLMAVFSVIVIIGYVSYVYSYLFKLNVNVDAFAGVSGGIFYIFGFFLLSSIVDKNSYPERFWISIFSCTLVAFLAPLIACGSTSHISHAVGFVIGFILCAVGYSKSKV